MRLTNLQLIDQPGNWNLDIQGNRISSMAPCLSYQDQGNGLDLGHGLAFPGLINSHDHLDFNCFSPLHDRSYSNYTQWGDDIHHRHPESIRAVLAIPQPLRTQWGIYKNLLAGVTTVINHGEKLVIPDPLIRVQQNLQNLHSVSFQKRWKHKLNDPRYWKKPCVIHAGEGTDALAYQEIDELLYWNLFRRSLVAIHGVAMQPEQAARFKALVWCPVSNESLLAQQPAIRSLHQVTRVIFGTDSTLTGSWNIWEHLRQARELDLVSDEELAAMAGASAAACWGLNTGQLRAGKEADIVIVRSHPGQNQWDDFYATDPKDILLVIQQGRIRLFDQSLLSQVEKLGWDIRRFSTISQQGEIKFVEGAIGALQESIRNYYPAVRFGTEASVKGGHYPKINTGVESY